jgi:two-component system, LuxR family, sensor kinase FixL
MNWIIVSWPMVAAASLTLGLVELRISISERFAIPRLMLALSAFAMVALSCSEFALMRASSIAEAASRLRWMDAAIGATLVTLTAFIWSYFGTGRKWLALAGPILFAVGNSANWVPGSLMNFTSIRGLRTVETFGGATFNVVQGITNPWILFAYAGGVALLMFVMDATIRLWRRGDRRRAVVVGGGVVLFVLVAIVQAVLVDSEVVRAPYAYSWAYLAILVVMVNDLNADLLAAARVATDLAESERRVELASSAVNLGLWTWDLKSNTVWATPRARTLFGLSDSEPLDQDTFTKAVHPEDREARQNAIEIALENSAEYELELRVPLADGEPRWVVSRGRVERDANGKPVLMRGVVFDISARRRIQLGMQHLQAQLVHASRVSMLGQLATALAHELSQPLGAILCNTDAAELFLKHDPPNLEELRAILADIRRDDQRAGQVIQRLRALLKRGSFDSSELSVSGLLRNVIALTTVDAANRKVKLDIAANPELPQILGDPVHVQQVLLNLVLNAMDAVQELPPDRRQVTVSAACNERHEAEFSVRDCGSGIGGEHLARLFEPFFTTKPNGMGIGLSISRTIIEAHGGRIWAENNPEAGATFRFTLPFAPAIASP